MHLLGAYTASNKCPMLERVQPYETRFLCTYTAKNLEFFDTLVHIHVHMVTMHEYKTIMMVLIVSI